MRDFFRPTSQPLEVATLQAKFRTCLARKSFPGQPDTVCGKEFWSADAGERICPTCDNFHRATQYDKHPHPDVTDNTTPNQDAE